MTCDYGARGSMLALPLIVGTASIGGERLPVLTHCPALLLLLLIHVELAIVPGGGGLRAGMIFVPIPRSHFPDTNSSLSLGGGNWLDKTLTNRARSLLPAAAANCSSGGGGELADGGYARPPFFP